MRTSGAWWIALGLVAAGATAQPPTTAVVAFQAELIEPDGQPVPSLAYRMRFSLYATPTGGSALWTETDFTVPVTKGRFSVALGSIVPFPEGLLAENADLFLEVLVDLDQNGLDPDDAQLPRTPLNAVFRALYAAESESLQGMAPSDFASAEGFEAFRAEDAVSEAAQDAAIASKADTDALFSWELPNTTAIAAAPNRGYVTDGENEVVVTLPVSESLAVGETIRISGMGAGGWRIVQREGQQVLTASLGIENPLDAWEPVLFEGDWTDVDCSDDGMAVIAVADGEPIQVSGDGGRTWQSRDEARSWTGAAASSDGSVLIACASGDAVYVSSDGGATFVPRDESRIWVDVDCAGDGGRIVAVAVFSSIRVSDDGGETWGDRFSVRQRWTSVSISADGQKAIACTRADLGAFEQGIVVSSTNGAATWSQVLVAQSTNFAPRLDAYVTPNGNRFFTGQEFSVLFVSLDGGFFDERPESRRWRDFASNGDGTRIVAADSLRDEVIASFDGGASWRSVFGVAEPVRCASSADASRLFVATSSTGPASNVYAYERFVEASTPGADGGLRGGRNSAIEVQYLGNGDFLPIGSAGALVAF